MRSKNTKRNLSKIRAKELKVTTFEDFLEAIDAEEAASETKSA